MTDVMESSRGIDIYRGVQDAFFDEDDIHADGDEPDVKPKFARIMFG